VHDVLELTVTCHGSVLFTYAVEIGRQINPITPCLFKMGP